VLVNFRGVFYVFLRCTRRDAQFGRLYKPVRRTDAINRVSTLATRGT